MTTTTDTWALMLLTLAGAPLPAPPEIQGRRHRAPSDPERDEYAERWDERTTPAKLLDADDGATPD